jgi:hypothetical protein
MHCLSAGLIRRGAFWQREIPGGEKVVDAVETGTTVEVGVVVPFRIEWREEFPGTSGALAKIGIEHLLPDSCVDVRRLSQYTVEIERAR